MSDETPFLSALLARPDDDELRLVYADWLEDRGDPRATFLREEAAFRASTPSGWSAEIRERYLGCRSSLDARWVAQVERPGAGWRVVRVHPQPRVYGKAFPAFIHNGTYFLTTVDVYADGAINCWGFVDGPLFRDKLAQGWVASSPEVGEVVCIDNLGNARVAAAEWNLTPADVEVEVLHALRELNPAMEGLLDMQGTAVEERDGRRYAKLGMNRSMPYRVTLAGDETPGAELPVLEATPDGYRLRPWLIYADGLTQLGSSGELLPLEAVARLFDDGRLTLSVPEGAWVTLDGLGRFQAGEGWWGIEPCERVREAVGLHAELNGSPSLIRVCVEAFVAYRAEPSPERREVLRFAYEAVPEHRRVFCGDMDSKDRPIRDVLYPDEQDEIAEA